MSSLELPLTDAVSQPDEQFIPTQETSATSQFPQASRVPKPPHTMSAISSVEDGGLERHIIDTQSSISSWLKDKDKWPGTVAKQGPMQLLDLPMDILKEIVKEVRG